MAPRYKDIADAAMNDEFTLQGLTSKQPRLPTGGYDWNWRGPNNDPEWAWFFNRLGWFTQLWQAAHNTHDPRYRDRLYATLKDWITSNPPPSRFTFASAWRPLEVARRLLYSWLPLIKEWEEDPLCPQDLKQKLALSLHAHGQHLFKHHALGGNHLVTEMLALVALTAKHPELDGATEWTAYAYRRLEKAYKEQVYPDGVHKELSSHYHRIVTQNFTQLLALSIEAKRFEEIETWTPRVDRMWRYLHAITKPDGSNPINNDSDREDFAKLIKKRGATVDAQQTTASIRFPYAGHTIFRGTSKPHWAFFDNGPRGTDHQHDDFLSICISIGHSDFLVDCGRYTYTPNKWRTYFTGAASHNLLLIDGVPSDQGPKEVADSGKPDQDNGVSKTTEISGSAIFQSAQNARFADWKRSVNYKVDIGWSIQDTVTTFGQRVIQTLFHLHPDCTFTGNLNSEDGIRIKNGEESIVLTLESNSSKTEFEIVSGQEYPSIQGWYSERFQSKVQCPTLVVTQRHKGPLNNIWTIADQAVKEATSKV